MLSCWTPTGPTDDDALAAEAPVDEPSGRGEWPGWRCILGIRPDRELLLLLLSGLTAC